MEKKYSKIFSFNKAVNLKKFNEIAMNSWNCFKIDCEPPGTLHKVKSTERGRAFAEMSNKGSQLYETMR